MSTQTKIKVKDDGIGASKRRSIAEADHWAFLEEFEAPMWADLSLESTLSTEDNNDAWFHTSHPFHYHSARRLRSAFAHPDVGNDIFNFNLQGPCSPHLPFSVSKSRGNNYRIRDRTSNCRQICLSKGHPINDLGGRFSSINSVSSQEAKSKVNHGNQSKASNSITSEVDDSVRSVSLKFESASTSGVSTSTTRTVSWHQDLKDSEELNDAFNRTGDPDSQFARPSRVSKSTLKTLGWQQNSKVSGESKDSFALTGGLLNSLRTNLRKSHATRPALRLEVSDNTEANNHKISSGKLSVSSSCTGPVTKGEGSAAVSIGHSCKKKSEARKSCNFKSNLNFSSTGYDTKGRKSSAGKSHVGSSTGYDRKGKKSAAVPKSDHCQQVKVKLNVHIGSKDHKSSFGRPNQGFSYAKLDVNEMAAGVKLAKDKVSNLRDLRQNLAQGKGKAKKVRVPSVRADNSYSSKKNGRDVAPAAAANTQKTSNSKVFLQTTQKILLSQSGIAQGVEGKVGGRQFNKFACRGKENLGGRAVSSHRSGDSVPSWRVSDHKVPGLKSKYNVGVTSAGSKVRIDRMNDAKKSLNARVYLR
ncbi:uncharacterized protein LOC130807301 [Amaranthus tricolor]|uniref:uncharacterized protein LOC130807301 n=1 Tax=Amaranthus tricolor TaxID=29722 RepID=UPI0025879F3A|nr:uncharacterized protein LOC130807301 [Amaranthus tricolor]